jgi:hypothetical protein
MSSYGLKIFYQSPSRQLRWRLLLALAAVQGSARAQSVTPAPAALTAPEQVELRYLGGPECPGQASFVNDVASRIRRPIEWVSQNPSIQIVIRVAQTGAHATGTLEVVGRSGEPTRREFVGSTCAEISSALALVAALALDPNARTGPLAAPAEAEPVTPPAPAVEPSPTPAPVMRPSPAPEREPAPRRAEAAPRYRAWLGPTAGVALGYAPQPLVVLGVSLGARAAMRRGFSPSFQLTPMWGKTGSTGPSVSSGTFAYALTRLQACPTELRVVPALSFEPCVAGELGRVAARGEGSAVAVPVAVDRWWAAAGAALALHLSVGHWFSRLETQALFPITRDKFVFRAPERQIQQADVLVYGLSLSVGFEFGQ